MSAPTTIIMNQHELNREIAETYADVNPFRSGYHYVHTSPTSDSSSCSGDAEDNHLVGKDDRGTIEADKQPIQPMEIEDHISPRQQARLVSMYSSENLGLLLSYLVVGFAMSFTGTPVTVYAVQSLNTGPAQLNVLGTVLGLPWSFKVFYGLISDCCPIWSKRRKPYWLVGWLLYIMSNFVLASMRKPSLNCVTVLGFLGVCGYMLADVMCDSLVVERSKLEAEGRVGSMQAVGYVTRYIGNVLGSVCSMLLYNQAQWHWGLTIAQVFLINGLMAVIVLPFAFWLRDDDVSSGRSMQEQLDSIWSMVQKRTIYRPMTFIGLYNILMIPNGAWPNFLLLGLHFTPWMIGVLSLVGTICSWLGISFYRLFMLKISWRQVYVLTTALIVVFSCLQLMLVFCEPIRRYALIFSLGDDALGQLVQAIQFLPSVTMYIALCPSGAESTSYAMLTTFANVAGTVGSNIGTMMTGIWDVSNGKLETGDWSGLAKLTILTSLLQPIGLLLLPLLPKDMDQQKAWQKCEKRSFWGGVAFMSFLVGAWLWTLGQALVYMARVQ